MVARRNAQITVDCPACDRDTPHLRDVGVTCRVCGLSGPDPVPDVSRLAAACMAVAVGLVALGIVMLVDVLLRAAVAAAR